MDKALADLLRKCVVAPVCICAIPVPLYKIGSSVVTCAQCGKLLKGGHIEQAQPTGNAA